MLRRTLIASLAPGVFAPLGAALAQAERKVHRIGVLGLSATADLNGPQPRSATSRALMDGLEALGHAYGKHFTVEARGSEGRPERFPELVTELLRLQVNIIVATGAALPALKQATSTVPIVMAAHNAPVAQGLVQSLARPGGNITGLSLQTTDTTGKRLELLKELVPGAAPTAVVWNSPSLPSLRAAEEAARVRAWKLLPLEIRELAEVDRAFQTAKGARAGSALVIASAILFPHRVRVAELAARSRLPAMYELRPYVEAGGLISYGADINDIWRRAAGYVDKILKGAKPADLPVEQPTKFELVINGKAARALGLKIPYALALRASEVIE